MKTKSTKPSAVINTSLYSLTWPIYIDLFLQFLTVIINTYMISRVSTAYLASIGIGNTIFQTCVNTFNFVGIGCAVVVAQYLGARNKIMARRAIHISLTLNFIIGLLCAVIILVFGEEMLTAMNMPSHLMADGLGYLQILGVCLIPQAIYIIISSGLKVYGKPKWSMYVTLIVNGITVIGNVFVLYGVLGFPRLGLVGVAWSTTVGRTIGILLLFYLLFKRLRLKFSLGLLYKKTKGLVAKIFKIGLPAASETLLWIGQYAIMLSFIGLMGEKTLAAQTLYIQVSFFTVAIGLAIAIGNEIMVGHLVGARLFDRAYASTITSIKRGMLLTIISTALLYLFKYPICELFTKDLEVVNIMIPLFLIAFVHLAGKVVNMVVVMALRATGDAIFPLYMGIIFMWCAAIPLAYFLCIYLEMGLIGIWIAFLCDEWLRSIANYLRWRSRKWESKRLDVDAVKAEAEVETEVLIQPK